MIWLLLLTCLFQTQALPTAKAVPSPRPEMVFRIAHRRAVTCVACSPNGKRVATGSWDQTIKIWEAETGDLLHTLPAASEVVGSLAFSPDSRRLITSSYNTDWEGTRPGGHVQLWDVETGQPIQQFGGETEIVFDAIFSPDGKEVAVSSQATRMDKSVAKLWDAQTGTLLHSFFGHSEEARKLRFSPDGSTLAGAFGVNATAGGILLWDTKTGKETRILTWKKTWVSAIAFSPDGKTLASAQEGYESPTGPSGQVVLWNIETGEPRAVLADHGWMTSLAYSPAGDTLATVHYERRGSKQLLVTDTCLWNAKSGVLQRTVSTVSVNGTSYIAYAPDGKTLIRGEGDGSVQWLDARTLATRSTVHGQPESAMAFAFSPESDLLAMSGYGHETTLLWNTRTGKLERQLVGSAGKTRVVAVAFASDARTLATASISDGIIYGPGALRLWDVQTGRQKHRLSKMQTERLSAFAADGKISPPKIIHRPATWTCLAFSPDGTRLFSGGPGKQVIEEGNPAGGFGFPGKVSEGLAFWDTQTGALQQTPQGETGRLAAIAISPDGRLLAGGGDTSPILWDSFTGKRILQMHGLQEGSDFGLHFFTSPLFTLAFSPDGKTLASGGPNGMVRLWNVAEGSEVSRLKGHTGNVNSVAFSSDGTTLASAGSDGTVRLWNLPAGTPRLLLPHDRPVTSVAFSADGRLLASGCRDGALRLWNRSTGHLLVTLEAFPAPDGQTPIAWIAYTPEGYYEGSADLPNFLRWRLGDRLYPATAFAQEYYHPERVEAALQAR